MLGHDLQKRFTEVCSHNKRDGQIGLVRARDPECCQLTLG